MRDLKFPLLADFQRRIGALDRALRSLAGSPGETDREIRPPLQSASTARGPSFETIPADVREFLIQQIRRMRKPQILKMYLRGVGLLGGAERQRCVRRLCERAK